MPALAWVSAVRLQAAFCVFTLTAIVMPQLSVQAQDHSSAELKQEIRFGSLPGPNLKILNVVKAAAASEGLIINIVEFTGPEALTEALDAKTLDAAEIPNTPFLDHQIERYGYELHAIGYSVTQPMGLYAKTISTLRELKSGDTIAIPDDPINGPRALILLHNFGLLGLEDGAGLHATLKDITQNPKNLQIVKVASDGMANAFESSAVAAIPYSVAAAMGLDPARDSIAIEDGHSPYAGILVTRENDQNAPWATPLVKAYHSNEVKAFLLSAFKGSIRRPW